MEEKFQDLAGQLENEYSPAGLEKIIEELYTRSHEEEEAEKAAEAAKPKKIRKIKKILNETLGAAAVAEKPKAAPKRSSKKKKP